MKDSFRVRYLPKRSIRHATESLTQVYGKVTQAGRDSDHASGLGGVVHNLPLELAPARDA